MMRAIYYQAARVLIWLGEDGDSEMTKKVLELLARLLALYNEMEREQPEWLMREYTVKGQPWWPDFHRRGCALTDDIWKKMGTST
jgi:hypothetical protein